MYYLITALGLSGLVLVVVLTLLTIIEDYFDKPRLKIFPNHLDHRPEKWKKRR